MDGGAHHHGRLEAAGADGEKEAVVQLNRHKNGAERTVGCNLGVYYLPTTP